MVTLDVSDQAGTDRLLRAMKVLGQEPLYLTGLGPLGRYMLISPEQLQSLVNQLRTVGVLSPLPASGTESVDDSHWLFPDPGVGNIGFVELRVQ